MVDLVVFFSPEKTVAMDICRKRIHNHRDSEIRLKGHRLEIRNTHKILGLTFEWPKNCDWGFCVCRTENILCESGLESLAERRRRKTINTASHVVENETHPVNEWFREEKVFDNYMLLT
jgi:hypothetical protein